MNTLSYLGLSNVVHIIGKELLFKGVLIINYEEGTKNRGDFLRD